MSTCSMSEYFPLYISRKWHICIRFFCPNEILYSLKFCLWFSSIVFLEREKKGSGKSWLKKFLSIVFEQTILLHSCEVSFRVTVHPFVWPWESIYFTHQLHTWHFNTVSLILMGFRNCIMIREKCFIQEMRHQSH